MNYDYKNITLKNLYIYLLENYVIYIFLRIMRIFFFSLTLDLTSDELKGKIDNPPFCDSESSSLSWELLLSESSSLSSDSVCKELSDWFKLDL